MACGSKEQTEKCFSQVDKDQGTFTSLQQKRPRYFLFSQSRIFSQLSQLKEGNVMFHNVKIGAEKDCHIWGKRMKTNLGKNTWNDTWEITKNSNWRPKCHMKIHTCIGTDTHSHRPAELWNAFMLGNQQESLQFSVSEYYTHMETARGEIYPWKHLSSSLSSLTSHNILPLLW